MIMGSLEAFVKMGGATRILVCGDTGSPPNPRRIGHHTCQLDLLKEFVDSCYQLNVTGIPLNSSSEFMVS
jgi:hypothetical protein